MGADEKAKGFKVNDRRFSANAGSEGGNGAAERSPEYPTYVEQLRAELADKDQKLREYIAAYKEQIVRGIEETKERLGRDAERERELLRGRLVGDFLEVLDNLDRSLQAAGPDRRDALVDGVRLVREQFAAKLAALGLVPIAAVGERFDPTLHEAAAIGEVTDPEQDGRVLAEIKPGYRLGERVLRPVLVQVGKLAAPARGR